MEGEYVECENESKITRSWYRVNASIGRRTSGEHFSKQTMQKGVTPLPLRKTELQTLPHRIAISSYAGFPYSAKEPSTVLMTMF